MLIRNNIAYGFGLIVRSEITRQSKSTKTDLSTRAQGLRSKLTPFIGPEPLFGLTWAQLKLKVKIWEITERQRAWERSSDQRCIKEFMPKYSTSMTKELKGSDETRTH